MADTQEAVWVKNLRTGHTQAMEADFASYYLNQRDPDGVALYEEGSAPEGGGDEGSQPTEEDLRKAELRDRAARRGTGSIRATKAEAPAPQPARRKGYGVPDAANMEVATSASETGPTQIEEMDSKAVTNVDYQSEGGPDRVEEGRKAAETSQEQAHADAKEAASKAASKAEKK